MPQALSRVESDAAALGHSRRRGEAAIGRLLAMAQRSPAEAARVAALLTSVADAAEQVHRDAQLPDAEQQVWSSVGADASSEAPRRNDEQLAAAFADLVSNSVIGDAAMAATLSVDRSRISQRVADHSIYAYSAGDERCFPRWQLANGKVVGGLKPVLLALDPELHPLVVHAWFITPSVDLEIDEHAVSPALWLATGGSPAAASALAASL